MKKVLIITYYWPPSGGIGVLRCLKIAKYLRRFQWEPIIFTAKDAHYPSIDHSNNDDVPDGVEIIRAKIWEPYTIYKVLTGKKKNQNVNDALISLEDKSSPLHNLSVWIRSNFFIPDARAAWIRPSVKLLSEYLRKNHVDAIFSCGPPHTNTRIATLLKIKFPHIAYLSDFQDPWTQVDYFDTLGLTKWGLRKHQRQEQAVFKNADAITIVSKNWKKDLESIGARNVSVAYWGYDPDDFEDIVARVDEKFTIAHIGIMSHDRNPKILFEVLKELCLEDQQFANQVELKLIGQVDYRVRQSIEAAGIIDIVNFVGSVKRREALQACCNSQLLLLLLNQQDNAKGRVPGKFFEYLASQRPILCLGTEDGDVADILSETNSGVSIEYDKRKNIKAKLLEYYEQYKRGQLKVDNKQLIEKYSIQNITGQISAILNEISK